MNVRVKKLKCIKKINDILSAAKRKNYKMKVSFTFDAEMYTKFQMLCDTEGVAQSRLLEEIITSFMERHSEK